MAVRFWTAAGAALILASVPWAAQAGGDQSLDYQTWKQAEAGDAISQVLLYDLYVRRGDYTTAYIWLEKAADADDPRAVRDSFRRFDEGGLYPGDGQKVDHAHAFVRLKQMERLRLDGCETDLGVYYLNGWGVKADAGVAVRYLTAVAEANGGRAQELLGRLYAEGRGVPRDPIKAYVWISLDVSQRIVTMRELATLGTIIDRPIGYHSVDEGELKAEQQRAAAALTPEQRARGDAEIAAFRAKHPITHMTADQTPIQVPPAPKP